LLLQSERHGQLYLPLMYPVDIFLTNIKASASGLLLVLVPVGVQSLVSRNCRWATASHAAAAFNAATAMNIETISEGAAVHDMKAAYNAAAAPNAATASNATAARNAEMQQRSY
jgi:hypothetical protein